MWGKPKAKTEDVIKFPRKILAFVFLPEWEMLVWAWRRESSMKCKHQSDNAVTLADGTEPGWIEHLLPCPFLWPAWSSHLLYARHFSRYWGWRNEQTLLEDLLSAGISSSLLERPHSASELICPVLIPAAQARTPSSLENAAHCTCSMDIPLRWKHVAAIPPYGRRRYYNKGHTEKQQDKFVFSLYILS